MDLPSDRAPIRRFMVRVATMARLRQSDIRLSLAEAAELSASLAGLLAGSPPVLVTEPVVQPQPAMVTRAIDGGGLKR